MTAPDLKALRLGDADAWDQPFRWLWLTALAVAQLKLQAFLPGDVEDVAIESLEELVEKVKVIKHIEELKPLAASIAHHRAISRLREHFAKKRGGKQTSGMVIQPGAILTSRRKSCPTLTRFGSITPWNWRTQRLPATFATSSLMPCVCWRRHLAWGTSAATSPKNHYAFGLCEVS